VEAVTTLDTKGFGIDPALFVGELKFRVLNMPVCGNWWRERGTKEALDGDLDDAHGREREMGAKFS